MQKTSKFITWYQFSQILREKVDMNETIAKIGLKVTSLAIFGYFKLRLIKLTINSSFMFLSDFWVKSQKCNNSKRYCNKMKKKSQYRRSLASMGRPLPKN